MLTEHWPAASFIPEHHEVGIQPAGVRAPRVRSASQLRPEKLTFPLAPGQQIRLRHWQRYRHTVIQLNELHHLQAGLPGHPFRFSLAHVHTERVAAVRCANLRLADEPRRTRDQQSVRRQPGFERRPRPFHCRVQIAAAHHVHITVGRGDTAHRRIHARIASLFVAQPRYWPYPVGSLGRTKGSHTMSNEPELETMSLEERQRIRKQMSDQAVKLAVNSRWLEAANINRDFLRIFGEEPEALNRLGKALSELGQISEARDVYGRALDMELHQHHRPAQPRSPCDHV
jgi:hypothetical protein